MTAIPLEAALRDRLVAEEELEGGWAGTILIEPLTALAGGILGGLVVGALAWRMAWAKPRTVVYVAPRSRPAPRV